MSIRPKKREKVIKIFIKMTRSLKLFAFVTFRCSPLEKEGGGALDIDLGEFEIPGFRQRGNVDDDTG